MKTLIKNGKVIQVFSENVIEANILIEDGIIIGVGDYSEKDADKVIDAKGKYISPGFIDGHIHIESSMLEPKEFAKVSLLHGTTTVVTDPHEITNACGRAGLDYMMASSKGLPLNILFMLPSCVPATGFDESLETLNADQLEAYIDNDNVLGLAEMMNYVGVIYDDVDVKNKLKLALSHNKLIDGHAPLLQGRNLDKYISGGINSDHECSTIEESKEKIDKGQWLMIRNGTAARNLKNLVSLFDGKYSNRCLLVTDDKEPDDLLNNGEIDSIIRESVELGKDPLVGIRMATIQAASCFGLKNVGALAPCYKADLLFIDDLDKVSICDVLINGEYVVKDKQTLPFKENNLPKKVTEKVYNSVKIKPLSNNDLHVEPKGNKVRVIEVIPSELITNEIICDLDFSKNNGIDVDKDILKIAVIERHKSTGHIGIGYIKGIGLKEGAIASTVSHDSHNIIVIGTNDEDMLKAINELAKIGGGNVVTKNNQVLAELALPVAGLMSDKPINEVIKDEKKVREIVHEMGISRNIAPFMNMAFVSLPVIPHLKITTKGYVDVDKFQLVDLFVY